jgi:surface antigen
MPLTTASPLILTDPGFIFTAVLASAEPTHAAAGSSYDADTWPVAWVNMGATLDGSKFTYQTTVEAIKVAEFFDPIRWSTTDRSGSFGFVLANYTLHNLRRALNAGTGAVATVSGTGATLSSSLTPPAPGQELRTMVGWESLDHTLRFIAYQVINGASVESEFKKAPGVAGIPFELRFEVPASGVPFKWYGAGTARLGV